MAPYYALLIVAVVVTVVVLKANAKRRDNRSVKAYRSVLGRLQHVVVLAGAAANREDAHPPAEGSGDSSDGSAD